MKNIVGSTEAKTKLSELLRQVKTGKSFTITSRGEAIAELVPSPKTKRLDQVIAVERMKAFVLENPVPEVDIKALMEEGRA